MHSNKLKEQNSQQFLEGCDDTMTTSQGPTTIGQAKTNHIRRPLKGRVCALHSYGTGTIMQDRQVHSCYTDEDQIAYQSDLTVRYSQAGQNSKQSCPISAEL
jgi:hypothetical protein